MVGGVQVVLGRELLVPGRVLLVPGRVLLVPGRVLLVPGRVLPPLSDDDRGVICCARGQVSAAGSDDVAVVR